MKSIRRYMKKLNTAIYIDLAFCLVLLPILVMMLPLDRWAEQRPTFVALLIVWLYILYGLIRLVIVPQIFAKRYFLAIGLFLGTILLTHELTLIELDFKYKPTATIAPSTPTPERSGGGGAASTPSASTPSASTPSASASDSTTLSSTTPTPPATRPATNNNRNGGNGGNTNNNNRVAQQAQNQPQNQNQNRNRTEGSPEQRNIARRNFTGQQQQSGWFLYVLVVSFGYAVALLSQLNKQISLNKDMALEKKRAELALYKAQINPHFLFNTLNTIYGLIITKSDEAEEAFMLFTNLMKYIYTNGTADLIPVDDEVEYIKQYIGLQSLRMNDSTKVEFNYANRSKSGLSLRIAPMLLITFVENAIKYGVSSHAPSQIKIDITIDDNELRLTTHNPILNNNENLDKEAGIGIKNCRQRLQLLYPKHHTLSINDDGSFYDLELTIQLT